ncbi:TetR family transcriptional regulator [Streptomyces sp. NPDC008092]|uniref:TetR/AcrR family transcriptional regulator n=1 Tax=Streptomyces sp. NPDC008092 TaxID=3364808 RepID=UPI0036ED359B
MTDTPEPTGASGSKWKGLTADQRRELRRAKLLDAGFEILGTQGAGELGVRSACRRAGLTERYFYESFDSRESLIAAVVEQVSAAGFARMEEARRQADTAKADPVKAMIRAYLDFFSEDPRRGRIQFVEAKIEFPPGTHPRPGRNRAVALFTELLATDPDGGEVDAVDHALNTTALVGSQGELIMRWVNGQLRVPKERMVRHILGVFRAVQGVSSRTERRTR